MCQFFRYHYTYLEYHMGTVLFGSQVFSGAKVILRLYGCSLCVYEVALSIGQEGKRVTWYLIHFLPESPDFIWGS